MIPRKGFGTIESFPHVFFDAVVGFLEKIYYIYNCYNWLWNFSDGRLMGTFGRLGICGIISVPLK